MPWYMATHSGVVIQYTGTITLLACTHHWIPSWIPIIRCRDRHDVTIILPPETSVLWVDAPHTRTICSNHGSAPPKCRHSWSAAASEVLQSRCAGRGLPSGPRLSVSAVPTPAVPCVRGGGMTRSRIQKSQPTSIWITILVPGSL